MGHLTRLTDDRSTTIQQASGNRDQGERLAVLRVVQTDQGGSENDDLDYPELCDSESDDDEDKPHQKDTQTNP